MDAQHVKPGRQVVVTGYAKMPEGTAVRRLYEQLTLGAIVDLETHTVVSATCTLVTPVGREWLESRLLGVNLLTDGDAFIEGVQNDYWGQAQSAIVQCFRDLTRRYRKGLAREQGITSDDAD